MILRCDYEEDIKKLEEILKCKSPCSHPGCYSHQSHPCEICGRISGFLPKEEEYIIKTRIEVLKEIIKENYGRK